MDKPIMAITMEPGGNPVAQTIENTLEAMQGIVGGYIEVVPLGNGLLLICNEEGKLKGLDPTIWIGNDFISGSFIVCRSDGEEFSSITAEDTEILLKQLTKLKV